MPVTFVGVGNSAGQTAGVTTTAGICSITATRAASLAGDRIFVLQTHNCTTGSAATPANWTALYKDVAVGTGTPGAGTGQRFISCYYRDFDGIWAMPAFALASVAQNSHALAVITLRKDISELWATPTASGVGAFYGTPGTAFTATTPSCSTGTNALLLLNDVTNGGFTATTPTLTGTNGFVAANVTERADGAITTGNDVSIKAYTADVTTGATGTLTHTQTLSSATEGGFAATQQTVTLAPAFPVNDTFTDTDGVLLMNHTSETGHKWEGQGGRPGEFTITSNRIYNSANPSTYGHMLATAMPPSADYEIEVDFYFTGGTYVNQKHEFVTSRAVPSAYTMYGCGIWWNTGGTISVSLRRWIAGAFTNINTTALGTVPPAGETHTMIHRLVGSTHTVWWDGAIVVGPLTDTGISANGPAGVGNGSAVQTAANDIQITRFVARTIPAANTGDFFVLF